MAEHTKGPWRYDKQGVVVAKDGMICDVGFMNVSPHANGKLIAAAPALLEACKAWMKVESEMPGTHPSPCHIMRTQYRKEAVRLTEAAIAAAEKE